MAIAKNSLGNRRLGSFGHGSEGLQFGFQGSTGRKAGLEQLLKGSNPFDISTAAEHSPMKPVEQKSPTQSLTTVNNQTSHDLIKAPMTGGNESAGGNNLNQISLPKIKRVFVSPKKSVGMIKKVKATL